MTKDWTVPFILIRDDGWATEFYDLVSLARALREAKIYISDYHVVEGLSLDVPLREEWIVRDDRGRVVSRDDIMDALPRSGRSLTRLASVRHAEERGLPIPYTGRSGHGSIFRQNRFIGVNRASVAAKQAARELDVKAKIAVLPTNWDDRVRSSLYDRNWKRFRKTQWKNKR